MSIITHFTPTLSYADAHAALITAIGRERLYDETVWTPAFQAHHEHNGPNIPKPVTDEIERLMEVRCDAEEVMIAAPANSVAEVRAKLEYARWRWQEADSWPDAWWNAVLADLGRMEPFTPVDCSGWNEALDEARLVRRRWGQSLSAMIDHDRANPNCGVDDPEHVRLEDVSGHWWHVDAESVRTLLKVPAPTIADAIAKVRLAIECEENAGPAIDDLYRLTGTPVPAVPLLETV